MGGLDSVVGKLADVLPQLQRLLGSQRLDVEHPDVCEYAKFLLLGLGFCLFELLVKDLSIQGQFSTKDDVLLHKNPPPAAVKRPAADLLTLVADSRVRVESRLL